MFVVTMTQRSRESSAQRVSDFHAELQKRLGVELPDSWSSDPTTYRQVFSGATQVVEAALHAMRLGTWNVGVGVGAATEQDGELVGPGVKAADVAVSLAAKQGQLVPLRIEAAKPPRGVEPTQLGKHAQSVLQLLGHVVSRRSSAEWAVLDRLDPGVRGQQRRVAEELGMTVQAVSQAIKRSLYNTEHEVRAAASLLLDQAAAAVDIQSNSGM
ncbi:MAG TPA: hypothetical protein VIG71_06395 [Enteractinococcus sp.]